MAAKSASRSSKAKRPPPKPAPTAFARRLVAEMGEMTYEQFADRLGVPKSQLHDWIHGAHEPTLSTLREIAKKFDCDVIELIEAA